MSEVLKGVQARDSGSVTKGNSSSTEESLLSIVTSQRERFKQRNVELETVCCACVQMFYRCYKINYDLNGGGGGGG